MGGSAAAETGTRHATSAMVAVRPIAGILSETCIEPTRHVVCAAETKPRAAFGRHAEPAPARSPLRCRTAIVATTHDAPRTFARAVRSIDDHQTRVGEFGAGIGELTLG